MQELFPPVQMYILLAIVATLCTIVAANVRDAEGVQLKGTNLVTIVLMVVATVSAGQIFVVLAGEFISAISRGDLPQALHMIFHISCIVVLYFLLIIWYGKAIFPRSQFAG